MRECMFCEKFFPSSALHRTSDGYPVCAACADEMCRTEVEADAATWFRAPLPPSVADCAELLAAYRASELTDSTVTYRMFETLPVLFTTPPSTFEADAAAVAPYVALWFETINQLIHTPTN